MMIGAKRSVLLVSLVLAGGALAGCGDSGSSSSGSTQAVNASPAFPIDRTSSVSADGLTISGIPTTTAVAGQPYSFKPQVSNATSKAVSFSVQHAPSWAKFDTKTGALSGIPTTAQVGEYTGITISMVAGTTAVALPAFTITVASTSQSDAVTLSWQPPTENADGTPLVDLKGYRVHYGSSSKSYSDSVQLSNPGLTTYVVDNLKSGKYYFAVTAYNAAGQESSFSPEVSTQVD